MPIPEFIRALRAKIGHDPLHLPTVAVLARDNAGRLLLVQDAESQLWVCPGGIVEPHEIPSDAAVRETWEEAGVAVELTHLIGVIAGEHCEQRYANGDEIVWIATLFAARAVSSAPRGDGQETVRAGFFTDAQTAALPCTPHLRRFLEAERVARPGAHFAPATWQPPVAQADAR